MRRLIFLLVLLLASCSSQAPDMTTDEQNESSSGNAGGQKDGEIEKGHEGNATGAEASEEPVEIIKDERSGIVPKRIEVPTIGVDAPVRHLGLLDNGEMAVPESLHDTSWFEPGYKVGAPGNSVIAGHVDDTVNPGVFKQLHKLEPGDEIIVHGASGDALRFEVYDKQLYDADTAPVDDIFGYSHRSLLNLITCEGPYNYDVGGTPNRWVVYTELDISEES